MKPTECVQLQRRQLAEWLKAWHLAQRLEALPDLPETAAPPSYSQASPRRTEPPRYNGGLSPLQAGSIVLLPPDTEVTRSRPVYVALIEATEGDRWRVVPFGRFALPALPGELATGRRAPPLRVLCVWNSAVVDSARLAQGWQVGQLLAREMRWVRQRLDLPENTPPPAPLARRLGPPLIHPLDPRHDYIEEERLLWEEPGVATSCGEVPVDYGSFPDTATLPLAAEKNDDYR